MPGQDGTGPQGKGSGTGRGLGQCNNGKGFGSNRRRGGRSGLGCRRGFGRYFYDDEFDPKIEKAILQKQKKGLELELKSINDALKNYDEEDDE